MAKSYRQLLIDCEVHDELLAFRERLSMEVFNTPQHLGLGSVVKILMEHARGFPPDMVWLRERTQHAPQRGRPRRSDPNYRPRSRMLGKDPLGHDWTSPKANPALSVCRNCDDMKTAEYPWGKGYKCPRSNHWTRSSLFLLQFTEEEIGWCDEQKRPSEA